MKIKYVKLVVISILFIFFTAVPKQVSAKSQAMDGTIYVTDGAFTFEGCLLENKAECRIKSVRINASKGSTDQLIFPERIQGASVTEIGAEVRTGEEYDDDLKNIFGEWVEPWHDIDGYNENMKDIQSVIIPDSVKALGTAVFSGMRGLKTVKLSRAISTMPSYAFYCCKGVKNIALPEATKQIGYGAFSKCESLASLSIPQSNKKFVVRNNMLLSKDKKKLVWVTPAKRSVKVPNTVRTICTFALADSRAKQLHIGKNVSKIEVSALDCASVSKVTIDKKNKTYAKNGSCIYRRKNGALAVGIVKKQKLTINKKVKCIPDEISLCGYGKGIYVIDFAASVKKMESNWINLCNTEYNGLNNKKERKIYFRSVKPPKMVVTDSAVASFPYEFHIYAPKKSIKQYKKWVKKYKGRNVTKAMKASAR